jgi:hypothetical protein
MAMTLITTNTSSNAASSSFTSSIDSTYKLYIFKFYDVNPATDGTHFMFQVNVDGQSGYNETITSASFVASHKEDNSGTPAVAYEGGESDQAQETGYQKISANSGNASDESLAGELYLFNPSNTTYVKHFYSRTMTNADNAEAFDQYCSGYVNVTGAIDEISFKMSSGNMDAVIKMYGVG